MKSRILAPLAILLGAALTAPAAEPIAHPFVCTDYTQGVVCRVSRDGTVERLAEAPSSNDLWVLPGGNILFVTGHGVKELVPGQGGTGGSVVFTYESKSSVYACQRLANGNTFVAECELGRLLEVSPNGEIVREVRLLPEGKEGGPAFMRNARALPNGNYLVAHYGLGVVREYASTGLLVREIPASGGPHSAVRLPDGNTLIAVADGDRNPRVIEVDPAGKIVWQFTQQDVPGLKLSFMTGLQRLANGNTVMTNWLGHGQIGQGPHVIEVTRSKRVEWAYADHAAFRTISSIVLLDAPGDCTKGEILH
jgi:hypothetical protein